MKSWFNVVCLKMPHVAKNTNILKLYKPKEREYPKRFLGYPRRPKKGTVNIFIILFLLQMSSN